MIKYLQLSRRRVYYYVVFTLLTLIIVITGRYYYNYTIDNIKERAYHNIKSFAEWKIKEIVRWKDEKHSEAEFLNENNQFKILVYNHVLNPSNFAYRVELEKWLKSLFRNSDYTNAILFRSPDKYVTFFEVDSISAKDKEYYHKCRSKNRIILTNFRKNTAKKITLDFFIPLTLSGNQPFAILMLRINPAKYLFPIIKRRPALSETGESYIFQREQDSIVIISDLHKIKFSALNYKISLKKNTLPSIKAALGFTGIYEGIDYSGDKVLADMEKVPHTPWFIVSKIDSKEIFLPVREQTYYIIIVFILLILVNAITTFILWKNEKIKYYNQRLKLEQERNVLRKKLDYLVKYANDCIILMDSQGYIQDANEKTMQVYGYELEELLSMTVNDLRGQENQIELAELIESIKHEGGLIYETIHEKKNGEKFPVEVSSKVMQVGGKEHLQYIVRDISDRKKAEESLRIYAGRFQEMFNVNIMGICLSDINGKLIDANDYYLRLIGYSREEFLQSGMNWKDMTPPEFLSIDNNALLELQQAKRSTPYEKQYITKSGEFIWVLVSLAIMPGTEMEVVAFFQDITERKKSEMLLINSEERFRTLADNMSQLAWMADEKGKIVWFNKRWFDFTGKAFEDMKHWGWTTVIHPDDLERVIDKVQLSLHTGEPWEDIYPIRRNDGEYKWFLSHSVPIRNEEGYILRWFGTSTNITEQRIIEEELLKSREQLSNIINTAMDGVIMLDNTQKIVLFNKSAEKLFQVNSSEAIGNSINKFIHRRLHNLQKVRRSKSSENRFIGRQGYVTGILANGEEIPLEASISGFVVEGNRYYTVIVRDIRERKKAEEALKKSEEKFMTMFNDSPVALGLFDIQSFKTININRAFEQLYGFTKEELIGKSPILEVFTDKRQRDFLTLATLKGRTIDNYELNIKNKKGVHRVVTLTNIFLEIDDRRCLFSVSYDITDRKMAEDALKRSEEKFQRMFQDSPVSMVLVDVETSRTVDINSAFEKLFGYKREEIIGEPPPPEIFVNDEQLKIIIAHMSDGKALYDFELDIRTRYGDERVVSVTNEFVEIENRNCVLSVAYDITDKKLVEEAMRKNEAELKQMADAIPHIIYSTLPDGSLVYINSRFGEYAGVNTQLYYNWQWTNIIHPEDLPVAQAKWAAAINSGIESEIVIRLRKYNGEYEWHLSRVVPIKDASGRITRWFGSATNINAQRKSYEEVQALLKEVERSNKDLEHFAYAASHDLQEPLRMIKSYIQLLDLKSKDILDKNSKEYIGFISEGSSRMQELINDLLKFSRLSSKKPELEIFDCNQVLNEVLSDLKFKIQDENARIKIESLPMVKGDRTQIRQIFQNFIQNSLKFRGERNPEIIISAEYKDNFWQFAIKDNGIGIEEKDFGRIFQIFQRLHEREKYPGTGIGLSLCKKIVERHGGNICLDSIPGQGTTFYFTLPAI